MFLKPKAPKLRLFRRDSCLLACFSGKAKGRKGCKYVEEVFVNDYFVQNNLMVSSVRNVMMCACNNLNNDRFKCL